MQNLLEEYAELFQERKQLPPTREIDHRITLKEKAEPINVRLYRYAYFQKAEIENKYMRYWILGLFSQAPILFLYQYCLLKKKIVVGGFVPITQWCNGERQIFDSHGWRYVRLITRSCFTSPNLTSGLGITRYRYIHKIFINWSSAHTMTIMNIW